MIGISKLYCGTVEPSDALRYGRRSGDLPSHLLQFSSDKKPVVVWNVTRSCNLNCVHCYAHAVRKSQEDELSREDAFAVLDDLAGFGVPVVLFSGGVSKIFGESGDWYFHHYFRAKIRAFARQFQGKISRKCQSPENRTGPFSGCSLTKRDGSDML